MGFEGKAAVSPFGFRGAPALRLETADGASAVVALHGAQLLSWTPAGGAERIFLSDRAELGAGKAIRGGVPICWPQFAALGPLPKHGFVRTRDWSVAGQAVVEGTPRALLALQPDAALQALWPHAFRLELEVALGGRWVELGLRVANTGGAPLAFTAALHGYLAVDDVEAVEIAGLAGLEYRDSAAGDARGVEGREAVVFRGEVDRVYHDVRGPLALREGGRLLVLRAGGLPDAVLWNPGPAKCAALPDMAPDGWRRMVCVEAGAIRTPVVVPPGGAWRGWQRLEECSEDVAAAGGAPPPPDR